MEIIESSRCSYCFIEAETIEHLFCTCTFAVTFYMQIVEWASEIGIGMPIISYDNIVLQNFEGDHLSLKNLLILLYKMIVFEKRGKETEINLCYFKAKVKNVERIEKRIATKKGKLGGHYKKWSAYCNFVQENNNSS